jgi:hypothetical protein
VLPRESAAAPNAKNNKTAKVVLRSKTAVKTPVKTSVALTRALPQQQVRIHGVPAPDPSQWMRAASGWTRIVRATDSDAGTYYAETLGLVIDSQYVIVPWTFISDVWLSRAGSKFMVEGSQKEAVLVDIDLVANVALLRASEPTVPTFYRTEIRLDVPIPDEPLLVVSSRNWLRGGAKFLKTKTDGLFLRYQIAFGANDPSSVRYVFDKAGRFIAMSSGASSGEDIWSAPSRTVYELIRKQSGPRPASVGDQRRAQLYYWQDRWAKTLVPVRTALSVQSLDCQTRLTSVPDRELAAQIKNVRSLDCGEKLTLPVGGGYSAGVRLSTGDGTLRSSSPDLNNRFAEAVSREIFADYNRTASLVNLFTVPECRDNEVVNQQGQSVYVKFCTSALKFEFGLADTAIVVSTLDQSNHANFSVARLKGFDQKNTKRILESLVENVRSRR